MSAFTRAPKASVTSGTPSSQPALARDAPDNPQPSSRPPASWSQAQATVNSAHVSEKLRQLTEGHIDASILQIVFVKFRQLLSQRWLDVTLAYHAIYKRLKMLSLLLWVSNGCKLASDGQQPWLIWHDDVAIRIEATGEITNQTLDQMENDLKLWLISAQNRTLQCSHSKDYPAFISKALRGILIRESPLYQMQKKVDKHTRDKAKLTLMNLKLSQLNNRRTSNFELKAKNDKLEDQNNRLELEVIFLDIELEGKNQQVTDLEEEKEAIRQDKLEKIEELEEEITELRGANQQLQTAAQGMQANQHGLHITAQSLLANVHGLQTAVQDLQADNEELQTDNEGLTGRTRDLEFQLRISNVELRRERYLRRTGSDYVWT